MLVQSKNFSEKTRAAAGFTLVEVVISVAILALVIQGVILGYAMSSRHADWSARSLAAQSVASEGAEQARAAKWDTQDLKTGDELGITNYARPGVTLDIPMKGSAIIVTNYVSVTAFASDPPVRQIRSDCVWPHLGRWFTNTVILLRAPDQ